MAKEKIEVELVADDKASSDIREVDRRASDLDGKKSTVEVDADTAGFKEGLEELDIPISGIASKLGGLASPAGAVAAIGAGLFLAAEGAAETVVEVDNLARLSGDTVEDASRMAAIWKGSGADLADLQDIYLQMSSTLASNAELAGKLGVNLNDGATQGQRFEQVVAALDLIPDATERALLASQLFGEEGVRQVNTLIGMYPDLADAKAAVADQAVFSDEDVADARKMQGDIKELKTQFSNFATAIGTSVIPIVSELFTGLNKVFDLAFQFGQNIGATLTFQQGTLQRNREITKSWEDAETAARDFDRQQLEGLDTFEEVHAAVLEVTGDVTAANLVAVEWSKTHEDAGRKGVDAFGNTSDAADRYVEGLVQRNATAKRELQDQADAVEDLETAYSDLHAEISDETSLIRLGQGFDDVRDKAVEAWTKTAEGADDAQRAQEDLRLGQLRQKEAVLDYIETLDGVPIETTTRLLSLVDQGKYDQAERELAELAREREATVQVTAQTAPWSTIVLRNGVWVPKSGAAASSAGAGAPTATTRGGASTTGGDATATLAVPVAAVAVPTGGPGTVNIYLPRTAAPTDVVQAVERWYRVNGRRT
jgi:hypothetical protein